MAICFAIFQGMGVDVLASRSALPDPVEVLGPGVRVKLHTYLTAPGLGGILCKGEILLDG